MNRLIIVGNGFDLSLRLKTSYNHFLTDYIQELVISLFKRSETRMEIVSYEKLGNVLETKDDLIKIKIPDYFFRDDRRETFIEKIKNFENFRDIIKFLNIDGSVEFESILMRKIYEDYEIKNWIDIEVLYFDTLISLYRSNEGKPDLEDKLRKYNLKFENLKSKLIEYLTHIEIDFENRNLDFYVDNFIEKLISRNTENSKDEILFLSFNYTQSLEELKKYYISDNSIKINHIHGSLNNPDSIIFGFGDEGDKDYNELKDGRSEELLENIKRFHYSLDNKYDELGQFLDSDIYEVWIVGHSCSVSDRTILLEIVQNNNCNSIKIFHYDTQNPKKEYRQKSTQIMKFFNPSERRPEIVFDPSDVMVQLQQPRSVN